MAQAISCQAAKGIRPHRCPLWTCELSCMAAEIAQVARCCSVHLGNLAPTPPSTYESMGAWIHGDALEKYYRDARDVRNFSRRGAWGQLAPLPPNLGTNGVHSAYRAGPMDPTAQSSASQSLLKQGSSALVVRTQGSSAAAAQAQSPMPGGTGTSRVVYMEKELAPGRLFNVASRGLPSGAQPKWSFDRMPSLLPPPLMRDRGVARSTAGVAPRVSAGPLPRAISSPELRNYAPGAMLPPISNAVGSSRRSGA